MASSNHNVLYAGTGESFFNVDVMNGKRHPEVDRPGASWTPLASTLNNPMFNNISRLLVDPTNPTWSWPPRPRGGTR
jgi:hypothetical protein